MQQAVTSLSVRPTWRTRALPWLAGPLAAGLLACSSAPQPTKPAADTFPIAAMAPAARPLPHLETGAPQEAEVAAGDSLEYPVTLAAGDYVRAQVEQTQADVVLRLFDPAGVQIGEADGPGGRKELDQLSWIAAAAGDYRLVVVAKEAGRTRLTLEARRPSRPGDVQRIEVERHIWEADHLRSAEDVPAKRQALARLEEAIPIAQESGDLALEADLLMRCGAIRRVLGETEAAIVQCERAVSLAKQSGDRRIEASALNNLAVIYGRTGNEPRALELYQESLTIWESLGDGAETGTTRYNLGALLLQRGEIDAALVHLERALELRRANGSQDQTLILTGIARARLDKGDPDGALELLQQALDISRRLGQRNDEANVLQHTASVYLRRGELQRSLEVYNDALDLYRRVGDRAHEGQILSSLGTVALYLGDRDRALELHTQALQVHRDMKSRAWEALALCDIGWIYELRKESQAALENFTSALESTRESGNLGTQAFALLGLGRVRLTLGLPREAIADLEGALALFRKTDNSIGVIGTLVDLGRAAQALGDMDRAAELFQQARDLSRQRKTLMAEAVAQAAVARLERDRGDLAGAAGAMEEALRILESVRPKVASQRFRASFFASRRDYFDFYVDLQVRMEQAEPGSGHLAMALATSERARARALLDLLAEGRIDVRQGVAPELKRKETEIAQRITWLQSRLLDDLSGRGRIGSPQGIEAELDQAEEERERLEWQIRREHPRYAAVSHPLPLQLQRIQELLDDRTALLEYSVGQEGSFLFVVTRGGLSSFSLPPGPELASQVDILRQTLAEPGRRLYSRYVDTAWQLYRTLIQPAEALLRDKPNLILVPDGPLLLLSFEALLTAPPDPARGGYDSLPYLILDRSVTYVPSASVLAELGAPRPAGARPPEAKLFLGFGDPDYGGPAKPADTASPSSPSPEGTLTRSLQKAGLPHPHPLPESRNEVTRIAGLFPAGRAQLFLGSEASEEDVKNNPSLKDAWRIHFAVHGFTDETRPELSGLVLALDGDHAEDGLLQVYEIFNLQLDADLVVLSACDTGLGLNVNGEGLLGVTRALLYAGASSVVVSLWQVADISTSELMIRFYENLEGKDDKADALRLSKLAMIRGGRFGHPYFWAPFILIGQPGVSEGVDQVTEPGVVRP